MLLLCSPSKGWPSTSYCHVICSGVSFTKFITTCVALFQSISSSSRNVCCTPEAQNWFCECSAHPWSSLTATFPAFSHNGGSMACEVERKQKRKMLVFIQGPVYWSSESAGKGKIWVTNVTLVVRLMSSLVSWVLLIQNIVWIDLLLLIPVLITP